MACSGRRGIPIFSLKRAPACRQHSALPAFRLALEPPPACPHTVPMNETPQDQRGFSFPGTFEVTAFVLADTQFDTQMATVLASAGVAPLDATLRVRPSAKGNYLSVSMGFLCADREHYEAAYAALKAHPSVKWTL